MSENVTTQEVSKSVPDHARVVLVPVANPETAAALLHLAAGLVHPEEGKIVALTVSLGDVEEEAKIVDELEAVLEAVQAEGLKIDLQNVTSTSVVRGILDTAREIGADMMIIGVNRHRNQGQSILGPIVENLVDTSICDVLIYRPGKTKDFKRVVLPVNSTFHPQVAARLGIRLAKHYETAIEAIYPQSSSRSHYEGLANIEYALSGVPGREMVKRTVVTAHDSVAGILSRTHEDDLIIVGFGEHSEFERWMFGDIARGMLKRAEGPVIVVSRAVGKSNGVTRLSKRVLNWIRPELTRVEQDDIIRQAEMVASVNIDYATLIIISAALAALGLLLNSPAIIIGAMLIAPFMQPLVGVSAGLTVGRVFVAQRALVTLLIGVLISILMSVIIGILLPANIPTAEMQARGSPTLLDAAVALASGVVGAYATARKDIPAALAGVAIAAALMPPVCTIGLGLAFADTALAFGATVLFLTNIVCIIAAGIVVFWWLGMRVDTYEYVTRTRQFVALAILIIVIVLVGAQLLQLTRQSGEETAIQREIQEALAPAELVEFERAGGGNSSRYVVTIRAERELTLDDVRNIQRRVAEHVGREIELELVVQQIVRLRFEEEAEETGDTAPPSNDE